MIGLSLRAYAKHRGVSDTAVRKAIATGMLRGGAIPDITAIAEYR